jgi:hypothetical protein
MAFDDLEETLEEQDQEDDDEPGTTMDATEFDTTTEETDDVQEDSDDEGESLTEPAFEFNQTDQNPLYARPRSWDTFEDMLDLDLEAELRERGIRDVPKREKHDAVLRFVAEHGEEIADFIEDERRDDE